MEVQPGKTGNKAKRESPVQFRDQRDLVKWCLSPDRSRRRLKKKRRAWAHAHLPTLNGRRQSSGAGSPIVNRAQINIRFSAGRHDSQEFPWLGWKCSRRYISPVSSYGAARRKRRNLVDRGRLQWEPKGAKGRSRILPAGRRPQEMIESRS